MSGKKRSRRVFFDEKEEEEIQLTQRDRVEGTPDSSPVKKMTPLQKKVADIREKRQIDVCFEACTRGSFSLEDLLGMNGITHVHVICGCCNAVIYDVELTFLMGRYPDVTTAYLFAFLDAPLAVPRFFFGVVCSQCSDHPMIEARNVASEVVLACAPDSNKVHVRARVDTHNAFMMEAIRVFTRPHWEWVWQTQVGVTANTFSFDALPLSFDVDNVTSSLGIVKYPLGSYGLAESLACRAVRNHMKAWEATSWAATSRMGLADFLNLYDAGVDVREHYPKNAEKLKFSAQKWDPATYEKVYQHLVRLMAAYEGKIPVLLYTTQRTTLVESFEELVGLTDQASADAGSSSDSE